MREAETGWGQVDGYLAMVMVMVVVAAVSHSPSFGCTTLLVL